MEIIAASRGDLIIRRFVCGLNHGPGSREDTKASLILLEE